MTQNLNNNTIQITDSSQVRSTTTSYRRYYHIPLGSIDPGASGATYTSPDGNTIGGWQLNAVGETLEAGTDIHADWDGASDLIVGVNFEVNVNNTGGLVTDTVDLKLVVFYKANGDLVTKTQTIEVATTVGQSAQYKKFNASFTINWDEESNVVEAGDLVRFILNLETDTSEVDDIIINDCKFYYNTTHMGIESGDV